MQRHTKHHPPNHIHSINNSNRTHTYTRAHKHNLFFIGNIGLAAQRTDDDGVQSQKWLLANDSHPKYFAGYASSTLPLAPVSDIISPCLVYVNIEWFLSTHKYFVAFTSLFWSHNLVFGHIVILWTKPTQSAFRLK